MASEPKTQHEQGRGGRGTSWQQLCADASQLPGVELGTSYRTPALFVRRKLLARLREDGETVAIGVDFLDRELLLEADPRAFFLTDHYRAYPWVLVRLASVRHGAAMELLQHAWRRAASARVVAAYAAGAAATRGTGAVRPGPPSALGRSGAPGARGRRPTRG